MNNLANINDGIQNDWSLLQNQWQTTASMWDDNTRRRFEREFMEGYEPAIHSVLKQMGSLAEVIAQAHKYVP